MRNKGFTIIELIMVIVILGIIATVAVPRFIDLRTEANANACRASGGSIATAVAIYYASTAFHGTPAFPAAADATTLVSDYLNTWPPEPNTYGGTGTWASHYDSSDGTLDVEAACP